MRVCVVGKDGVDVSKLKERVGGLGYKVVEKNPDIVISLGGDGSFLISERKFPSVPKLAVRNTSICTKCGYGEDKLKKIFKKIEKKQFEIKKFGKIEAVINKKGKTIRKTAINDIVIRNKEPYYGLRFVLDVNGKKVDKELIGDGIVVSTVFGSSGYFYSITRKTFNRGVGVAFNNITVKRKPLILADPVIKLKVTRHEAVVSADNDMKTVTIDEGDSVVVKKSDKIAKVVVMRV